MKSIDRASVPLPFIKKGRGSWGSFRALDSLLEEIEIKIPSDRENLSLTFVCAVFALVMAFYLEFRQEQIKWCDIIQSALEEPGDEVKRAAALQAVKELR